jgi:hypothetical protein
MLKQPPRPPFQSFDPQSQARRTCPSEGTPSKASPSGHPVPTQVQREHKACWVTFSYHASTDPSDMHTHYPSAGAEAHAGNDGGVADGIGNAAGSSVDPGVRCLDSA